MARLPQPGGDSGQWGDVLNDYLSVTLKADGTLQPNVVTGIALQNNSVSTEKLATTAPPVSGQTLTYNGSQLAWATPSGGSTVSDATASAKGIIQLTGDLSGTATSPTVPGLSLKENAVSAGTIGQYYRGDKTWQTLDKSTVGLNNVDNTADINKPISTATQGALDAKAALSHTHAASDVTSGVFASSRIPVATSGALGAVQLAGDLSGTATSPTVPGLSSKENAITAGTTSQYYRGDKSWQTLDKSTVGLANVDNTTDANKPISSATQAALDSKAALSHVHSGADITSGTISSARLPLASSSVTGVVQLATNAETVTGTDTAKAVTSAGVKAAIGAVTYPVIFVNTLGDIPPGTPVDTLVVVRAA